MAVNKVVYGNTTVMDITDTTATASDVAQGKYFYDNAGVRTLGTSQSGSLVSDLLWENDAVGSNFAAQTIELDLSTYEMVYIIARNGTNNDIYTTFMVRVGDTVQLASPAAANRYRTVTVNTTGLVFETGYVYGTYANNSPSAGANYLIPYQVYGIRRSTTLTNQVIYGTVTPSSSVGEDGDLYIQYEV